MVYLKQLHCDVDGCERPHLAKGLCRLHYYRLRNTGTTDAASRPERKVCSVAGCLSVVKSVGLCNRHYQQVRNSGAVQSDDPRDPYERFWDRVDRSGGPQACWPWGGSTSARGYGTVTIGGQGLRVHRLAWVLTNGPLPAGREVDHRCHDSSCRLGDNCPHRRCCNPAHLKAVTHPENMAAGRSSVSAAVKVRQRSKTHCPHGHPYTPENTYVSSRGHRFCRACDRERHAVRRRGTP